MPSFAEILAKKKAEAALSISLIPEKQTITTKDIAVVSVSKPAPAPIMSAGLAALLAKKKEAEAAVKQPLAPVPAPIPSKIILNLPTQAALDVIKPIVQQPKQEEQKTENVPISQKQLAIAIPTMEDGTEYPIELQQQYSDIKTRIVTLSDIITENLHPAMAELKKALKANPAACELLLDEDIGQMTIALRRMTAVAQIESASEKATKGKKKSSKALDMKDLTPEQLEAAWDDM